MYNFQGLARLGASVTGIDASEDLIKVAEKHKDIDPKIQWNKPEYINCTIEVSFYMHDKIKLLIEKRQTTHVVPGLE